MVEAHEVAEPLENAILVGVDRGASDCPLEDSLDELERLVDTAGARVVGRASQRLQSINPRTFIGPGKADEIAALAETLDVDIIVFDDELSPSQQSNLEKVFKGRKVIDRTALILDIFALHATSREGRLQVRLAQNQYLLPRLRGMWAHLASNRMGGGVGSRFGEGESQLEVDRRIVRNRITAIRRELADLQRTRSLQRRSRGTSGVYRVALAGYTNAGKSSLLNALTDSDVLVYDKLFATLDSTTRKLELPEGRVVTVTDTVGFIQKLPHSLVEAFRSTLDEISEADLILHVTDVSSDQREVQMKAVADVLQEIGAATIPTVEVFNKCDLIDAEQREVLARRFPSAVLVSATTGEGIDGLQHSIERSALLSGRNIEVCIPFERGDLVSIAHERCTVVSESYGETGTRMALMVPRDLFSLFVPFVTADE